MLVGIPAKRGSSAVEVAAMYATVIQVSDGLAEGQLPCSRTVTFEAERRLRIRLQEEPTLRL